MVMSPAPTVVSMLTDFVVPVKTFAVYGKILEDLFRVEFDSRSKPSDYRLNRFILGRLNLHGPHYVVLLDNLESNGHHASSPEARLTGPGSLPFSFTTALATAPW
jgi:hypothetical protein